MVRAACVLLGLVCMLPAPFASQRASRDVDAAEFALAFRAGKADEFKNKQISGAGTSFHGAIAERIADGSTRTSLVITLGSADRDGRLTPLTSWDEFVTADGARTTLVVALSGPNLPAPPTDAPTVYEFSGVYDGQVRTVARAPHAPDSAGSTDAGPCPGEQARGEPRSGSFYCAPLLTGATARIRR